jgi:hypothetical protein
MNEKELGVALCGNAFAWDLKPNGVKDRSKKGPWRDKGAAELERCLSKA